MGTWRIEITGTGSHHNAKPTDADWMASSFIAALGGAGHVVRGAKFILTQTTTAEVDQPGGATDLLDMLEQPEVVAAAPPVTPRS